MSSKRERMRLAGGLGSVVAVVVLAAATGVLGAGAASRTCGPASAHTLARDNVARIYTPDAGGPLRPARVYGCTFASGRVISLGGGGRETVTHAALGGVFTGYGLHQMAVDTGLTHVRVVDLRSGHVVDDTAAASSPTRPESFIDLAALVLNARGHVAWIGSKSAIGISETIYEVHKIDGPTEATLDSSTQIDPSSLRRHGRRISWKRAGAVKTASLN